MRSFRTELTESTIIELLREPQLNKKLLELCLERVTEQIKNLKRIQRKLRNFNLLEQ